MRKHLTTGAEFLVIFRFGNVLALLQTEANIVLNNNRCFNHMPKEKIETYNSNRL